MQFLLFNSSIQFVRVSKHNETMQFEKKQTTFLQWPLKLKMRDPNQNEKNKLQY